MAERSNRLPATRLFGNQPSPLRPRFLSSFGHVATLHCDTIFYKMGFAQRSLHSRSIQDVSASGMLYMLASRAVAPFAAHLPLCHLFRVDVVIDGVAPIAPRTSGPLHIVWRIKWSPPVRAMGDEIRPPNAVGDIPLSRFRKIVVSSFREVALLPNAAVNEGDLVSSESGNGVGGKIWDDGIRKFARIANNIGHWRFSPAFVDLGVARPAGRRADVVSRIRGGSLLLTFHAGQLAQAANEEHFLPTVVALLVMRVCPAGQAGEAHAITDDAADFSIREVLRSWQTQVWNLGVKAAPDSGLSGAVRTMASCTAVEETLTGFFQNFRRGAPWVCFEACIPRDG